jgi:hypothetical protein
MYKLLSLFLAGLLLASCRKDDLIDCYPAATSVTVPASSVSNLSLAEFSRRNGAPVQTFNVVLSAQAQTVTTTGGAIITLPANGFLLPNGTAASGPAVLKLREIYTVPDMVLANMPTNESGRSGSLLISGGEFNIQLYSNSQRLQLAAGSVLTVQSPIPANQDTTRQYVWRRPTPSATPFDTTGWVQVSQQKVQQLPGFYRATLPFDSLGWCNIDQYWQRYLTNGRATVTVNTPANTLTNTRVFLRPIGFNGLSRLYPDNANGTQWVQYVPLGSEVVVAVLQSVNGQLYYGTQRLVVQANSVVTPTLTPVNESAGVQLIWQL